jgi:uncharacterized protein (TIGR02597 family)
MGISGSVSAQQVTSGIFGYYKLNLLGNSDTIVSIPFARLPAATVQVSSFSGNVVQFQGSPGWTPGQFVYASGTQSNTYYARIESGALEGRYFDISTNDSSSLTLNLNGGALTGLETNAQVSIIPFWTFGGVFTYTGNPTNWNGIHVSTSPGSQKTSVLVRQLNGLGKNLIPAATYYLFSNSPTAATWRRFPATTNNNDDVLPPNAHFIIRNNSVDATYISYGDVLLQKAVLTQRLYTNLQDNYLGLPRPITLALNDLGFQTNANFVQSPSAALVRDQILVYDNSVVGRNKIPQGNFPAGTYYYLTNAGWRKVSGGTTIDYGSSNIFLPGAGFILRKYNAINGIQFWTNAPTY